MTLYMRASMSIDERDIAYSLIMLTVIRDYLNS